MAGLGKTQGKAKLRKEYAYKDDFFGRGAEPGPPCSKYSNRNAGRDPSAEAMVDGFPKRERTSPIDHRVVRGNRNAPLTGDAGGKTPASDKTAIRFVRLDAP